MTTSNSPNPAPPTDMTDAKRAELLHAHYKDTFDNILYHWKARNRAFLIILLLLAGVCVDFCQPRLLVRMTNAYVHKQLALESAETARPQASSTSGQMISAAPAADQKADAAPVDDFNAPIVSSAVLLVLLCMVINYYQRSIHVDRQYRYIERVEDSLNGLLGRELITREGKCYRSKTGIANQANDTGRPLFLRAVGAFYSDLFPVALSILVLFKLWVDWRTNFHPVLFVVNAVLTLALVTCNVLYLHWKHTRQPDALGYWKGWSRLKLGRYWPRLSSSWMKAFSRPSARA